MYYDPLSECCGVAVICEMGFDMGSVRSPESIESGRNYIKKKLKEYEDDIVEEDYGQIIITLNKHQKKIFEDLVLGQGYELVSKCNNPNMYKSTVYTYIKVLSEARYE